MSNQLVALATLGAVGFWAYGKGSLELNALKSNLSAEEMRLYRQQVYDLAREVTKKGKLIAPPLMLTAMVGIESTWNPRAYRYEPHIKDSSAGLMQTLFTTAKWLNQDMGYTHKKLTGIEDLYDPYTSVYFGGSYVDWIMKRNKGASDEFIVRYYNGGPSWNKSPEALAQTLVHWNKYKVEYQNVLREVA